MVLEHPKSIVIAGALTLVAAGPVSSAVAAPQEGSPSPGETTTLAALLPQSVEDVLLPEDRVPRSERKLHATYQRLYTKVRREEGRGAPGRNIVKHGVRRSGDVRPARRTEIRRSIGELHALLGAPAARSSTGGPVIASSIRQSGGAGPSGGAASGTLEAIAACESGGSASSVGGGGAYRGKYQFDQSTWQAVGGSGDPAAASEAEQDSRAAQLYAQQGASAWPTCG